MNISQEVEIELAVLKTTTRCTKKVADARQNTPFDAI
jgi:hypothetical protein